MLSLASAQCAELDAGALAALAVHWALRGGRTRPSRHNLGSKTRGGERTDAHGSFSAWDQTSGRDEMTLGRFIILLLICRLFNPKRSW